MDKKSIRLDWTKHKIDWTMTDWNKIIWSDESEFNLFGSEGRRYVMRMEWSIAYSKLLNLVEVQ